jgi:glycine/D-amino acid oxidase-like deaminating enzyme
MDAMKVDIERATMNLDRMQMIKLRGAKGVRLSCRTGSLWITQEGVARDDFLVPGRSQAIETDGVVVIEAMSASSLTIDSGKRAGVVVTATHEPCVA